jgi:hypothetical protein
MFIFVDVFREKMDDFAVHKNVFKLIICLDVSVLL